MIQVKFYRNFISLVFFAFFCFLHFAICNAKFASQIATLHKNFTSPSTCSQRASQQNSSSSILNFPVDNPPHSPVIPLKVCRMSCNGGGTVPRNCGSSNIPYGTAANCGNGGFNPCPGMPCCRPSYRPPACCNEPPKYGPIVIPLAYPCLCGSPQQQQSSCGCGGGSSWPPPTSGSAQRIHVMLNQNQGRPGCSMNSSPINCPPRCGPCGRTGHSMFNGCSMAAAKAKADCEIPTPCPRPQVPYSDGCYPPPCRPCCKPMCCNPLPPCCIKVEPCRPKGCGALSCPPPKLCCPNPCCPQPDPRCCPKPQILAFICPQNAVPPCPKKPCSC